MRSRRYIAICLVDENSWKHIDKMGNRITEIPVRLETSQEGKEQKANVRETKSLKSQSSLTKYYHLHS